MFARTVASGVAGTFQALKTRKIYSPGYVHKPNFSAEIWGVLLKTGGSMRIFSYFYHTVLLLMRWRGVYLVLLAHMPV